MFDGFINILWLLHNGMENAKTTIRNKSNSRTWTDTLVMDLQEVVCGGWGYGLDRVGSGKGQVVDTCDCGNEPSGSIKCGEFLD